MSKYLSFNRTVLTLPNYFGHCLIFCLLLCFEFLANILLKIAPNEVNNLFNTNQYTIGFEGLKVPFMGCRRVNNEIRYIEC